jgi:hypothetical protein
MDGTTGMGVRALSLLALLGCGLLGCDQQRSGAVANATPASSAGPPSAGSAAATTATTPVAPSAAASGLPVVQLVAELPAVARNKIPPATLRASKEAEDAGERAYKAQDFTGSIPDFALAIRVDPGNLHARYELSRSLVKLGDTARALELLSGLRDFGCPLCAERVLAARNDDAFAPLRDDPRYLELSRGLDAKLFKLKPAGQRIMNWLMGSALGTFAAEPLLDPRALVVIEDHSAGAKQKFRQVFGGDELRHSLGAQYPKGIYPGELDRCSAGCCTTQRSDIPPVHLLRVCFTTFGENVVHLYKLEVEGDPSFSFPG